MRPHSYSSEAIVLGRRNFGEADRILSVYARDHGRMSLIAKGTRRPASRKRGHIEIFNFVKFQAITGHGMDIMTEVEIIEDFNQIRKSLKKISLAYYFMEVIGKITHEQELNPGLFNILFESLTKLKTAKKLKDLRLNFILQVLTTLGYWPDGQLLPNPDEELEKVIERQIYSERVGKRLSI